MNTLLDMVLLYLEKQTEHRAGQINLVRLLFTLTKVLRISIPLGDCQEGVYTI